MPELWRRELGRYDGLVMRCAPGTHEAAMALLAKPPGEGFVFSGRRGREASTEWVFPTTNVRWAERPELTADEIALFEKYNQSYREKFDFPFVVCARLNKKETILKCLEARLKNSRNEEIKTALAEIEKIAYLRLQDIIES